MMKRIQLEVREERLQELKALMEQADLSTQKDLINDALTLFEWAITERRSGRAIGSMDEANQKYREVMMPSLERAASKKNGKTHPAHLIGA